MFKLVISKRIVQRACQSRRRLNLVNNKYFATSEATILIKNFPANLLINRIQIYIEDRLL